MWIFWFWYAVGQFAHILKDANLTTANPNVPTINTIRQYLKAAWKPLAVRLFVCSLVFWFWLEQPGLIADQATNHIGFALPLTKATAALFGFFSDSLLDWVLEKIPFLKKAF